MHVHVQAKATQENAQRMISVAQEVVDMWLEMMTDPEGKAGIGEEEAALLRQLDAVILNFQRRDTDNSVRTAPTP